MPKLKITKTIYGTYNVEYDDKKLESFASKEEAKKFTENPYYPIIYKTKVKNFCDKNKIKYKELQSWNDYGYELDSRKVYGLQNMLKVWNFEQELKDLDLAKKAKILEKNCGKIEKLALACYTINKEVKRQRDIKYNIAGSVYGYNATQGNSSLAHYQIQNAKENQQYLYDLKSKAINIMLDHDDIKVERHDVHEKKMLCLYIKDFSFHFFENDHKDKLENQKISIIDTDTEISEWIESTKKIKGMSLKTATTIIENYYIYKNNH